MKKLTQIKLDYLNNHELQEREKLAIRGGSMSNCCGCACNNPPFEGDSWSGHNSNQMNYMGDGGGTVNLCSWNQGTGWEMVANCSIY